MRFGTIATLLLLGSSQAFGAFYYELSTSGPQRLAAYNGGGQFRGTLYDGTTQIGVYASQCVDFLNIFPPNTRYQVSVSNLTAAGMASTRWGSFDGPDSGGIGGEASDFDTSQTRLAGSNVYGALDRYRMASWLMTQMQQYTSNATSQNNPNRNAIQDVIWELMNPRGSSPQPPLYTGSGSLALVQSWWNQARTTGLSQSASFYSRFRIITENPILNTPGNGSTSYQEQLVRVLAPEPADVTVALALALVGYMCWRRRAVAA